MLSSPDLISLPSTRQWKGKQRATHANWQHVRDDHDNDLTHGQVLPMSLVGSSAYDAIYTVSVKVGNSDQNLSLQVDTGSSDLWIASTSCSTSACTQTNGHLYDPSGATPANAQFSITYVQGSVSGPIVWDDFHIGNYLIQNQALSAANIVRDEPLSTSFNGILGLALPLNSYIAENVSPASSSNSRDGSPFSSNLFAISPSSSRPSYRFLSLTLERPESNEVPSLLGLGRHPSQSDGIQGIDASKVEYTSLVVEASGAYFWKTTVSAITVWVNGSPMPITLMSNEGGGQQVTAVVDSGMPIILTSVGIANGIYGALGVGPSSDGQYYLPCTTPLNLTISLSSFSPTPLHPLDLTTYPPSSSSSSSCIGLIQTYTSGASVGGIADMILGVPFMRSTYTVMGYDVPDTSGGFPNESSAAGFTSVRPKLGIQKLVDPEVALEEFNTVRVLNQPLKTGSGGGGGGSGTGTGTGTGTGGGGSAANGGTVVGGKKLSVGVEVLIGLVGFFGLCFVLFGARWAYVKRHYRLQGATAGRGGGGGGKRMGDGGDGEGGGLEEAVAYRLARRRTKSDPYGPSEETLRASRFEDFKKKKAAEEDEEDEEEERMGEGKKRRDMEMGYVAVKMHARSDSEESTADPLSNANKTLSTTATKMRAQQEWERESLFSTLGKQPQDRGQDRQSGGSIFEDIPYPPPNLPLPSSHLNVNTNIASTAHPINTATTTTTKLGGDDMDISDHSLSISPTTPTTTTRASRTMPNISSFDLEGGRYPSISSTVHGRGSWYPDERDSRYADARDSRYSSNRDSRYSSNRASGYMASYSGRDQHQRTDSGEAGPSMPLLAHTRSESSISRLADPINVNDNFNEDDVERVSERHDAVNRNPYQQQTYPPFQQGSSVRRPISEFGEVEDGFRRVERRGEGRGGGEERPVSGVAGIGTRRGSGMGLFTPPTTHSHPHPHTHSHTPSRSHQRQQFGSRDMNMSGNRMSGMSGLSGMTVVDEVPPLPSMMPMETTSVDSSMTGEAAGSRILPPLSSQPPIETQTAQGPLGLRHSHPSRTDQPLVGEQMHIQGRGLPPPHQQQQQSYAGASRGVNASSLLRGETPEYKETSYGAPDYLGSAPDSSRTTTTTGRLRVGGGVYGGSEMMSGAPGFQASDLSLSAKGSTGHGS